MFRIKDGKLQCIDHTANRINKSPRQQPAKSSLRQCMNNWHERKHTQPAHSNIQHRRNPFRTSHPECLKYNSQNCCRPHKCAKYISNLVMKNNQAHRRIASSDHYKDHHMIQLLQSAVHLRRRINGMIKSTCRIKQHHRKNKHSQCHNMNMIAPL